MVSDLFSKVRTFFAVLGGLYVGAVVLLSIPYLQTHVVYLNSFKFPLFADYDAPEKYGLARQCQFVVSENVLNALEANKTYNFKLETPDNETIGAWFVLADSYYHSLPGIPESAEHHVEAALKRQPTVLFLHGNGATRAFHVRVQHYKAFSSRWSANVLAIDYRGFADSSGTPTEAGVVSDARQAWDWLISHGASPESIIIVGHSLGTGIGSRMAASLVEEGIRPKLVLLSPFSSIFEVLKTYPLFGVPAAMKPLELIPGATNFVAWALNHRFDTLSVVPQLKGDIVIAHAENDGNIPFRHSVVLLNGFIELALPPVSMPPPGAILSTEEWAYLDGQLAARSETRSRITHKVDVPRFGSIEEFKHEERTVTYVQALQGKHDYIGLQEGVQDVIGRKFGLFQ